jgi:hypothetical protein
MTLREKSLISIAFPELASGEQNLANWPMKKPANPLRMRAFYLVAGVGFEPTTFRL